MVKIKKIPSLCELRDLCGELSLPVALAVSVRADKVGSLWRNTELHGCRATAWATM
jgi:hypothetical protein